MTGDLRTLIRAAARGAAGQVLFQLAGPKAGSVADDLAASVAESVTQSAPDKAVREAAGLGAAAALRYSQNLQAQQDGRADGLGLDPAARNRSWAGRYDGSE